MDPEMSSHTRIVAESALKQNSSVDATPSQSSPPVYRASASVKPHPGSARALFVHPDKDKGYLLVGGSDGILTMYLLDVSTGKYDKAIDYEALKNGDQIMCIAGIQNENCEITSVAVGTKSGKVLTAVFWENTLAHEFHNSSEINTSVVGLDSVKGLVCAGSWDGNVRVWSSDSCKEISSTKFQENIGSVCFTSKDNVLVGTSSGSISKISATTGGLIKTIKPHHKIVRKIKLDTQSGVVLSCGNDSQVCVLNHDLDLKARIKVGVSFLFAVSFISLETHLGTRTKINFAAGGEDNKLYICRHSLDHQPTQASSTAHAELQGSAPHDTTSHTFNSTLWDITTDPTSGDLFVAFNDGFVRVLTTSSTSPTPPQPSLNLSNPFHCPLPSQDSTLIRGKREGEIRMVNCELSKEKRVVVWRDGRWERFGQVDGSGKVRLWFPGDKVFKEGEYDRVFQIEVPDVQNGQKGGHQVVDLTKKEALQKKPTRPLPFNLSDDINSCAEKFITRENLNSAYKSQVIAFLTAQKARLNHSTKTQSNQPATAKPADKTLSFPIFVPTPYLGINADGLFGKLSEYLVTSPTAESALRSLHPTSNSADLMSQLLLTPLKQLLNKLRDPLLYQYVTELTREERRMLELLNHPAVLPDDKWFPVLDLFRALLMLPASTKLFAGEKNKPKESMMDDEEMGSEVDPNWAIKIIEELVGRVVRSYNVVLWVLLLKFLSNSHIHPANEAILVGTSGKIIAAALGHLPWTEPKVAPLLANFILFISHPSIAIETELKEWALNAVELMMEEAATLAPETTIALATATGNFLHSCSLSIAQNDDALVDEMEEVLVKKEDSLLPRDRRAKLKAQALARIAQSNQTTKDPALTKLFVSLKSLNIN
jgi:WD40 repeat protein